MLIISDARISIEVSTPSKTHRVSLNIQLVLISENMTTFFFYTLFYVLISGCTIYPPIEFVSAGLTIRDIFSKWLGNENELFVQYHLKRSAITMFVHSMLPFGYVFGLRLFGYANTTEKFTSYGNTWLLFSICTLLMPLYVLYKIARWAVYNWNDHPIAQNLAMYNSRNNNNNNMPWISIASNINLEYQRIDKIKIVTNSIIYIIVTDNWIIKILPYKIIIARQDDIALVVNNSETHNMSPLSRGSIQFINIKVIPTRTGLQTFDIRLKALDFKNFQDKVSCLITILQNITFHKTLLDEFIDIFKEHVQRNRYYEYTEELHQCIGCMQSTSNVKLHRQCIAGIGNGNDEDCMMCNCRPMWCVDCMAKWFAARQDENAPETWLSSKCTCPVCRARFCILDVCFVQHVHI